MSIWGWLKLTIAVWLFRQALRLTGWLLAAGLAVAAWPITVVAAVGYGAAWLRGWPPARLWHAAAWSLPMTAVYFTGQAIRLHSWPAVALAPVNDWAEAWRLLAAGAILRAGPARGPGRGPGRARPGRSVRGRGGSTRSPPAWPGTPPPRRSGSTTASGATRSASARGRAAAPGTVPLLTGRGLVAVGATIRAIGHRWRPVLAVPAGSLTRHSVIIGSSGSGKTNLMMRLWAGWYAATHATLTCGARGTGRC